MAKQEEPPVWRVWVNAAARVVSFHPAEGYCLMEFRDHEQFMKYVYECTARNYRYQ